MNRRVALIVAAVLGVGLLMLVVSEAVSEFRSSAAANTLLQCSPSDQSRNSVTGAGGPLLEVFPISLGDERTISPFKLQEPAGSAVLSMPGASHQVVVLVYDMHYLKIVRAQQVVGVSFRGIAPLDLVSIPADVRALYESDASYIIAPKSCLPA
ncbi:MAG: hypothetical protein JWP06_26 [Candidatus Saccharibacteria bacterium]|nr:hypothetical protein [Candidatus Saccharibacteria bacterium]